MKTTSTAKVIGLDNYRAHTGQSEDLTSISQLALKLQQSIEIDLLLKTFCTETADIIPCDSVRYVNTNAELNVEIGETQVHHCKYQLVLEGQDLGEIYCTRKKPFSIRETDRIERLLSLLIYPLRNALLYRNALAQARRDPLTQICNRAAFDEALEKEISSYRRHQSDFSLMMIDIDHFKKVNDTYGHIAGDKVIKTVTETIHYTIRRSDEVFRYGGEEFVVILSNTKQGSSRFIAERTKKAIENLTIDVSGGINITVSIGVSSTELIKNVNDTLDSADKALYKAKEDGRNRVVSLP